MVITAPQVDPLGEMFTPEEKKVLRSQDPGHQKFKAALIVRLADAFTFRRAPRDWQPPFNCFQKADMIENVDTSRYQLPAMGQDELDKANEVMEFVRRKVSQGKSRISSGVTANELKDVLRTAQGLWTKDGKDKNLASIIDNIPNNRQINKVVCIGISEIATRPGPGEKMQVSSWCLAQHLAVVSMVGHLSHLVSHKVQLFAADWNYDAPHEEALKSLGFTVLDASYGKQEHFAMIDNNTMVICFNIAHQESIMPIISEYARPVAMIYDAYDYLTKGPHDNRPALSPVWSQVKHRDAWLTIPGPPVVEARTPASWLPFYTESTGRMFDDYKIAMNLFEFDTTGLADKFDLHPDTDYRLPNAVESERKRFVGKNSYLFIRK
ncbi:hypothetical protein HD806DRAFT_549848 [Xylariaceae sp. AK1471]|nr:hypothetical protein HD806DRAFT_549848 [Xylariaceae sp. AK1471]